MRLIQKPEPLNTRIIQLRLKVRGIWQKPISHFIKTETNKYDGTVFTTINLNGQQCTYWFKDGMMTLDYGMTYDAPGFYFKKLKFTNQ